MSLIQAALNKTAASQPQPQVKVQAQAPVLTQTQTRTPVEPKPASAPRVWSVNLLDENLEKELASVQRRYGARRLFWWKVGVGVALLLVTGAVAFFKGNFSAPVPQDPPVTVPAVKSMALKAPGQLPENEYRLSGITNFNGKQRAVVNGHIVVVGDMITKQAVVKDIRQGEVLIDANGKEILLRI